MSRRGIYLWWTLFCLVYAILGALLYLPLELMVPPRLQQPVVFLYFVFNAMPLLLRQLFHWIFATDYVTTDLGWVAHLFSGWLLLWLAGMLVQSRWRFRSVWDLIGRLLTALLVTGAVLYYLVHVLGG